MTALDEWIDRYGFTKYGYGCDDLAKGLRRLPLDEVLTKRFVKNNNQTFTNMLVVDVDTPDAEHQIRSAIWDDVRLPVPNWMVTNPWTGHCHIGYWLADPLLRTGISSIRPIKYAARVHEGLRQAVGGDPNYRNGTTRNPFHEGHTSEFMRSEGYELRELAACLSSIPSETALTAKPGAVALGRNCTLFNDLRLWAYRQHRGFTVYADFEKMLALQAQVLNLQFEPDPLPQSEVRSVVRSVGRWVWREMHGAQGKKKFAARQSARARKPRPKRFTVEMLQEFM